MHCLTLEYDSGQMYSPLFLRREAEHDELGVIEPASMAQSGHSHGSSRPPSDTTLLSSIGSTFE